MNSVWLVILPLWIILGMVPALIALNRKCEKRGRISLVGFLSILLLCLAPWVGIFSSGWGFVTTAGWIITWIASLVWAIADEPERTTSNVHIPYSRPRPTCPNCRRTLGWRDTKCPHCAYHIAGQRMKVCPYCGENILHSAIFCRYCKSDIPNEVQSSTGRSDAD